MSALHDRGLVAVRRVREAREREAEAAALRGRLASAPAFDTGTTDEFLGHTVLVRALAELVAEKEEAVRRSATVAEEARRRWGLDRQAVRTVELLLERRAEERRQVRARREAADLDELATQAWLRAVTG